MQSWVIRSTHYDLVTILGGSVLTLLLALVCSLNPTIMVPAFWIWVFFFEGTHFWTTVSRTFFDKEYLRIFSSDLKFSLIFVLIPMMSLLSPDEGLLNAWGFILFLWSLYHNARQHFGFFSIYAKKARWSEGKTTSRARWLYLGIVFPQLAYLIFFKAPQNWNSAWHPQMVNAPFSIFMALSLALAVYALLPILKARKNQTSPWPDGYILTTTLFYSIMFFIVAPQEPFYLSATHGAQTLMLITIMNSLFHNIQYHAIGWHFSHERYVKRKHLATGLAKMLNGSLSAYIFIGLIFGSIFGVAMIFTGDWPVPFLQKGESFTFAKAFLFAVIGQHFYLDQVIWKPNKQEELGAYLGLQKAG
jgi:hypothetical protein